MADYDFDDAAIQNFLDPLFSYLSSVLPGPVYSIVESLITHSLALLSALFNFVTTVASAQNWDAQKILPPLITLLAAYLALLSDDTNHGAYALRRHDLRQFMRLDASGVRAHSLFPAPQDQVGGGGAGRKTTTLYGLLNKTRTAQGARLLGRWLMQPLVNLHEISKSRGGVQSFV